MAVLGDRAVLRLVRGDEIERTARQAVAEGFGSIIAAGGDGTIMTVAGAVAGTGRRFGVLALGTFNYFARGLGIPFDPEEAAKVILRGETRPLSLGEVNGQLFINNASLGVYPAILRAREDDYLRWGRRQMAAHWSAAKTFLKFQRPLYLNIRADDEEPMRVTTPLLFAARSSYQLDSFGLVGADCVKSGRFAVFVAPDEGRRGLFTKAWRLVRSTMEEGRDFQLVCCETLTVAARSRHLTVACDGEKFRMRTPLTFRMVHDAISVLAPSEGAGSVKEVAA